MEHLYLGAVPIAASLKVALDRMPNIGQVAVTPAGSGRTDVVLQIDTPRPGQAKRAMNICQGAVSIVKNLTVVDMDVDPWEHRQVDLARMTKLRAERDLVIIPGMPADRSEALENAGMVTKVGYDAAAKADDRKEGLTAPCRRPRWWSAPARSSTPPRRRGSISPFTAPSIPRKGPSAARPARSSLGMAAAGNIACNTQLHSALYPV
jgi:3-polyprenyl-4-hydroxybenzoate decarboxylase